MFLDFEGDEPKLDDNQMVYFTHFANKFAFFDHCKDWAKSESLSLEWAVYLMWVCLQDVLLFLEDIDELPKTEHPDIRKRKRRKLRRRN